MGRWHTVGQRFWTVVAVAMTVVMLSGRLAHSTFAQNPPNADAWHAVVDTDRLNVHSGRAEQFEKIGELKKGDVVLVKSVNTFGWAAIAPPPGLTGFVARQDVADGDTPGTVRAIGRVPVMYPISEDPAQCFRKSRVEPDTVMKVLAEVPTADNTMFLKIEMPEQVDVYVLAQFLRKATDEEVAAWKKKLADEANQTKPADEPKTQPKVEPKNEPVTSPEVKPDTKPVTPPDQAKPIVKQPEPQPETKPVITPPIVEPKTQPKSVTPPVAPDEGTGEAKPQTPSSTTDEPAKQPEEPIAVTLPNLEQLYTEMTTKPILDAEVEPLLRAYEAFDASTEKKGEQRVAEIRIELLKIRLDQQNAMRKLKAAAAAASQSVVVPKYEIYRDENNQPVFTAQGRLASSNVFDGRRLPLLYRIQDDLTGRTIAYLSVDPDDRLDVERRLNTDVGVIGETSHDPGLRIDVVKVKRIVDLGSGE